MIHVGGIYTNKTEFTIFSLEIMFYGFGKLSFILTFFHFFYKIIGIPANIHLNLSQNPSEYFSKLVNLMV